MDLVKAAILVKLPGVAKLGRQVVIFWVDRGSCPEKPEIAIDCRFDSCRPPDSSIKCFDE